MSAIPVLFAIWLMSAHVRRVCCAVRQGRKPDESSRPVAFRMRST